jgi:hypothetical protein
MAHTITMAAAMTKAAVEPENLVMLSAKRPKKELEEGISGGVVIKKGLLRAM